MKQPVARPLTPPLTRPARVTARRYLLFPILTLLLALSTLILADGGGPMFALGLMLTGAMLVSSLAGLRRLFGRLSGDTRPG